MHIFLLTHRAEVLVFERDDLAALLVASPVDAPEAALSDESLALVHIDDLLRVKVAALLVVVDDVAIAQVHHIIAEQLYALRTVQTRRCRALVLELLLYQLEQLIHYLGLMTVEVQHCTRLSIVLPVFLNNKLNNKRKYR